MDAEDSEFFENLDEQEVEATSLLYDEDPDFAESESLSAGSGGFRVGNTDLDMPVFPQPELTTMVTNNGVERAEEEIQEHGSESRDMNQAVKNVGKFRDQI